MDQTSIIWEVAWWVHERSAWYEHGVAFNYAKRRIDKADQWEKLSLEKAVARCEEYTGTSGLDLFAVRKRATEIDYSIRHSDMEVWAVYQLNDQGTLFEPVFYHEWAKKMLPPPELLTMAEADARCLEYQKRFPNREFKVRSTQWD